MTTMIESSETDEYLTRIAGRYREEILALAINRAKHLQSDSIKIRDINAVIISDEELFDAVGSHLSCVQAVPDVAKTLASKIEALSMKTKTIANHPTHHVRDWRRLLAVIDDQIVYLENIRSTLLPQ